MRRTFLMAGTLLPVLALGLLVVGAALGQGKPAAAEAKPAAAKPAHAAVKKESAPNPFSHVMDAVEWEISTTMGIKFHLGHLAGHPITKFMVLELFAAIIIILIFVPLARRVQSGHPVRGGWNNAMEVLLTFVRDDIARPNLGEHDADKYVPFLWTLFLFVLVCNLLGMIPFLGSPTASIYMTGGLALCSFIAIHLAGIAKMGLVHYLKSLWPHLDIPIPVAGTLIKAMICGIEVMGTFIKSCVLAVRLFANMFAGHTVLAMVLLFILMAQNAIYGLWVTITIGSVLGVVALSLLELFVAFLQAYIFVFLTALFMGMSAHPAH